MISRILFCILSVSILFLASCAGVRVTTNKIAVPFSSLPAVRDSTVIIGRFDKTAIDPRSKFIADSRIQGPLQATSYDYKKMLDLALRETQRLGGNIIKVTDSHNLITSSHSSSDIVFKVFSLPSEEFEQFRSAIAARRQQYKDSISQMCIVHMQFSGTKGFFGNSHFTVFFNGKPITTMDTHVTSFSATNKVVNLTFTESGSLSMMPPKETQFYDKFELTLGNEYWLFVRQGNTGQINIQEVKKDFFENDLWKPKKEPSKN